MRGKEETINIYKIPQIITDLNDAQDIVASHSNSIFENKNKINDINIQMSHIVTVDVKNFGAKGDGVTDDTQAIQNAIDFVSNETSSIYNTTYFGVVFLPKGVYNVTNLVMKSNVHIKGNGIAITRINPIGTSGYVFEAIGTNRSAKLVQCDMRDFTISPRDRFSSVDYGTRPNVGGINFKFCERISVKNVKINGIGGIGINNIENFDCYFENIEFVYVGTDSNTPALALTGTTVDSTNAIHTICCRFEACPTMLKLKDGARQNQFIGCKFEWSSYSVATHSVAGLIIDQCNQNTFVGCGFVTGDDILPLIKVATSVNDIRGLKFTGCDFIGSEVYHGYVFESDTSALGINITGCTFSGINKIANTSGYIQFNSNEIIDCGTPALSVSKGSVSNNVFQFMYGSDYVLKLNGSARCIGNNISSREANTCKGILGVNEALIYGNNVTSLLEGIAITGTGNMVRNNRNLATTPYNISNYDTNLIEQDFGSAISAFGGNGYKNQIKTGANYNCLNIYDGTTFQNIPIIKYGSTSNRPTTGRWVGMPYFDTSLKKMVYYSATANVWVDATGQQALAKASSAPTTGTYSLGDIVYNSNPSAGGYLGWVCIEAGTPGTWKGFGLIAS